MDAPQLAPTVEALLEGAEERCPLRNPDGRSAARFERLLIDGRPHVVKYVHPDLDFTMRVSGDLVCRTARAWAEGLLDAAPGAVDHAIVGAALGHGRNGWGAALLMRDVGADLLPLDAGAVPPALHANLVEHVTAFCASTWGWTEEARTGPPLLPYATRWQWFGHAALAAERALGWPERVPRLAEEGWRRFAERAPAPVVTAVEALRADVSPLARALRRTPSCLLHGDVKASNTGFAADGRTVLVDWAYVGEGPACHELAWHLALDRDRLPAPKASVILGFREGLERHGVDTDPWWDAQLELCLLGAVVQFGWEKALGDREELEWWCRAAVPGIDRL